MFDLERAESKPTGDRSNHKNVTLNMGFGVNQSTNRKPFRSTLVLIHDEPIAMDRLVRE